MSIIQSLAKIKQSRKNAKSKNTTCDVDLTIDGDSPTLSTNTQPSHSETGLGLLDYESSKEASERAEKKPRGKYTKYSDSQRHAIGKYASEYSTASTLRRYKDEFPELSESTVRTMRKKYEEELRKALQQKREPSSTLKAGRRGRPLLLRQTDLMVKSYLRVNKQLFFLLY